MRKLFLVLFLLIQAIALRADPIVFFSDLDWGPKSGWEGSSTKGAAVTIWGMNLGTGSGSDKVAACGVDIAYNSAGIAEWGATANNARGLQRITFWLNSAMTDGNGTISVTVGGVQSNTLPFTVTTGTIYFISVSNGDNSYNGLYSTRTGHSGSDGPFRDIYKFDPAHNSSGTGGQYIMYVRGGTYSTPDPDRPGFTYMFGPWGTSTSRKALIGYPAETVTCNTTSGGEIGHIADYSSGRVNYLTFSKLIASTGDTAFGLWGDYQRIIGCNFLNLSTDAWAGVVGTNNCQYVYIYGNYFYNTGGSSYKHSIYLKSNPYAATGDHANKYNWVGWNEFSGIMGNQGGIIFISTSSNPVAYTDEIYIHGNYFHNSRDVWIYSGDNVPILNVYIYNNIFGDNSINSTNGTICVGPVGSTSLNAYIYNNTFYKTGAVTTPIVNTTNYGHAILKNNILYSGNGQRFIYNDSGTTATSDYDLYYSESSYTIPSFATHYQSGDPALVNPGAGDYSLTASIAGTNLNTVFTTDYMGKTRGADWDRGAIEFIAGEADVTPPTLSSATVGTSGTGLTLVFSEIVSIGSGGNGGWTVAPSGGAATVSYTSGSGSSTLVYDLSRVILSGETLTVSYTQPGNGVEDIAGNDLVNISGAAVANNSTRVASSGTTYYVDTASTDGGDGTTIATSGAHRAWATLASVNAATLSAGDSVLFKRGCTWWEMLQKTTGHWNGTSGNNITFGSYGTGSRPLILGSVSPTSWTAYSGTVQQTTIGSTAPVQVWFSDYPGTLVASADAIVSAHQWYYASNILYVYATSNPMGTIEASQRDYGINFAYDSGNTYLTIQDFEVKYCGKNGIYVQGTNNNYNLIYNIEAHHNGYLNASHSNGIEVSNNTNNTIRSCICYWNGAHGILVYGGTSQIVELCICYDNYHSQIDSQSSSYMALSLTSRYNLAYMTGNWVECPTSNGFFIGGNTNINNTSMYYNIAFNCYDGLIFGNTPFTGTTVYNCTFVNNSNYDLFIQYADVLTIKNCIFFNTGTSGGGQLLHRSVRMAAATWGSIVLDYNDYFVNSGNVFAACFAGATSYSTSQFANYKSDGAGEAHGFLSDPLFLDAANNNYALTTTSPCFNAGVNVGLTTDFAGHAITGLPDVGALEYLIAVGAPPFALYIK